MQPLDIFDWLTKEEWLAILRIGIGLWWLESVRHKDLRAFLRGGSRAWVESLLKEHPLPIFGAFIQRVSLNSQNAWIFTSWLVVLGELSVGISLTFGFLTFIGLIVGILLNLNYLLLAGLKDLGEQGQNAMMILIQVVLFTTSSGNVWGLDSIIF